MGPMADLTTNKITHSYENNTGWKFNGKTVTNFRAFLPYFCTKMSRVRSIIMPFLLPSDLVTHRWLLKINVIHRIVKGRNKQT